MEIRQPLTQAVESVAQAVEDLAVNAHISLRELKNTVAAVIEKKLPKYAQLMEMYPVIAARTVVGGATLTAYENGYAVYEEDGAHTVMAINRCGDYRYDFNDGTYEVVPAAVFEDAEWSVRLVMEGERRMESNRSKTVAINEAASLDCDGSDWSDAVTEMCPPSTAQTCRRWISSPLAVLARICPLPVKETVWMVHGPACSMKQFAS